VFRRWEWRWDCVYPAVVAATANALEFKIASGTAVLEQEEGVADQIRSSTWPKPGLRNKGM